MVISGHAKNQRNNKAKFDLSGVTATLYLMKELSTPTQKDSPGILHMMRKHWMLGLVLFASISTLAFTADLITSDNEYLGRTVIEVKSDVHPGIPMGKATDSAASWSGFMRTQVMILCSEETLLRVVQNLNLSLRWSLSKAEATAKLSRMLETIQEPGTQIITIEVYSTSWDEAADLANAIREAYFERRIDHERERQHGMAMASKSKAELWEIECKDLQEKLVIQEANLSTAAQAKENAEVARPQAGYNTAKNALKVKLEMLDELKRQISRAEVVSIMPMIPGMIHEVARPQPTPARPDPLLLIPAALGKGLFYSIIVAFVIAKIRAYRSSRTKAPSAIEPAAAW